MWKYGGSIFCSNTSALSVVSVHFGLTLCKNKAVLFIIKEHFLITTI